MKQALAGLKVVELGNILAGPFCGTLMADFGAEIIKIEPPGTGDLLHGMGRIPELWFATEARNKKNITLDAKSARGKINWAGEELGRFNDDIFRGKLGLSAEEIDQLKVEGVI